MVSPPDRIFPQCHMVTGRVRAKGGRTLTRRNIQAILRASRTCAADDFNHGGAPVRLSYLPKGRFDGQSGGISLPLRRSPGAVDVFGPPTGALLGKYAVGEPPAGSTGPNLSVILRAVGKVLGWRLRGKAWPHPFFNQDKSEPVYPVTVLSREEREALRPLCGPRPAAEAAR